MRHLNGPDLLRKTEVITLILAISSPLLFFFLELPLSIILDENIFDKFIYAYQISVTGVFFLFFTVFLINNILTIITSSHLREKSAVQLILSIVLIVLFGTAFFPQIVYEGDDLGLKSEIVGFLMAVVYGSLILYLFFIYFPKVLSFFKKMPYLGIAAALVFFISFAAYTLTTIWILSEKVRDLRWENAIEIKGELESLNEIVDTLWEERISTNDVSKVSH